MLSEIFKALLITSLAGSCFAAVLMLIRPITKKIFGCAWHYYIWLAVLVVMILPVRFNLPQNADVPPVAAMQTVQVEQTELTTAADNALQSAQEKPNMLESGKAVVQKIIDNRLNILSSLWLIGMATLILINLTGYIRLIMKMRKKSVVVSCPELANFTDKRIMVRIWENTSSPFMTGIFRPTLVLPARELTEEQLNNILRHEMTHFKRHDILYKWFVSLVKCVHWFNPVAWYVSKQINQECEISCDLAVTLAMDKSEEMSYIDTVVSLLSMGKTKQIPLTTQMASNKKTLKRRFIMIKNKKKTSKFVSVISALAALVMLSTTVFASGVLSDLTTDDYTVEILNKGVKVELANKPFIENGEVYVPLREIFEKLNVINDIRWDNGKIDISLALPIDLYQNNEIVDTSKVEFFYEIQIGSDSMVVNPNSESAYTSYAADMLNVPVLKNDKTYITYDYMDYMLGGGAYSDKRNVIYSVYDKNGALVYISGEIAELIWNPEPEIFTDPYSDFLTTNITTALGEVGLDGTYSYEYINHIYNNPNDKVDFRYSVKPFDNSNEAQILKMTFEKRGEEWVLYHSEIVNE